MAASDVSPAAGLTVSPPGVLFALLGAASLWLPFLTLRANRIVAGEGAAPWEVADPIASTAALIAIAAGLTLGLLPSRPWVRFAGSLIGLAGLVVLLALGAATLLKGADNLARVSPAAGFWCLLAVIMLLMADAIGGLRPGPRLRFALLAVVLAGLAVLLWSGALNDLSPMQEYRTRAAAFRTATWRHVALALGSLGVAAAIGFPLGILAFRRDRVRAVTLPVLSFMQTIPSLAMFGIMIPILGWVGDTVPGAQSIGIAGIGFAPAFVALLLYSLLPVVANTVAGLGAVPATSVEAARGMGMTAWQRFWTVELPLALPVILAGLRIVLVQNIGLAVIAGLIGGGGFGTFVFQGLNQTATDLILLGALPTVLMALVAAILMDIVVEIAQPTLNRKYP
ncbi:ABC transporter permease [Pontibaca salina]|uniref:ABC transporter permease n=1 Tax=Pontibaca salina TaxID=2795731 RepID=A0A934M2H8_9RHOB|nr:ABC transporter permease [Pontibaca salina]MBI6628829.1 ABC transporter permease [Pontibaca salina]